MKSSNLKHAQPAQHERRDILARYRDEPEPAAETAPRKTKTKPKAIDVYFGIRLRALRKLYGDSQQMLGEQIDVTFQQIQKYEKGTNSMSHARACEIAKLYNVPISYFSEGFEQSSVVSKSTPIIPFENRGPAKAAQLLGDLGNARVQKAILNVLQALVDDRAKT